VDQGDRKLIASKGDREGLAAAASAYRQAAAAAKDDPDIHIRHAIALVALGRSKEADEATSRAVALDGRLSSRPEAIDPAATPPVVARGIAILREIGMASGDGDAVAPETLGMLADRWAGRAAGPLAAIAGGASAAR
jgi:hypothetical protein